MKFSASNLGILGKVEFELGNITVVCGKNNTGKTYASYTLYGFLKTWHRLFNDLISRDQLEILEAKGVVAIDLEKDVGAHWGKLLKEAGEQYKKLLPAVLAAEEERFEDTVIKIDIPKPNFSEIEVSEYVLNLQDKPFLGFRKDKGQSDITISLLNEKRGDVTLQRINDFVTGALQGICFGNSIPSVFMASSERTGAAIFKNELNFSRTRLIEAFSTLERSKKLSPNDILPLIIPEFNSRYAFPVRDSVDFVNALEATANEESQLAEEAPEILEDFRSLLGGEYKVARKVVYFVPTKPANTRLALGESSSAVRSLLDIGFYLKHRARKGELLMIDEPELNLHPANQRKIARLLARIANFGVKVFITTHSDYIVKELNTLLLLSRVPNAAAEYGYKSSEILDPSKVKVYIARSMTMKRDADSKKKTPVNCFEQVEALSDGGFAYSSFDETIDEMTSVQQGIWEKIAG